MGSDTLVLFPKKKQSLLSILVLDVSILSFEGTMCALHPRYVHTHILTKPWLDLLVQVLSIKRMAFFFGTHAQFLYEQS